ncbi:uncharacterized protein TNCV_1628001 [Trichonephila clavipes]|nr:uncharacterized protein TNCV_1628001 [Trichonephila clavipes]
MCLRSCALIKQLTEEILRCPVETFKTSKQFEILRRKAKIDEILNCIEDVFSIPSFLILVANLFLCSCMLLLYLHHDKWEAPPLIIHFERALYVFSSSACLFIMLWMAGGTSIKERRFREIFYQKAQSRMLSTGNAKEPRIERWLLDKPEFVFTGWDIVSYRRNTVFAVLGTLITYSVLVVNK